MRRRAKRTELDRYIADNLGAVTGLRPGLTPRVFLANAADTTVLSYPKSGKTWLSYLATAYIADYLDCPPKTALHVTRKGFLRTISPEAQERFVNSVARRRTPEHWAPLLHFLHHDALGTPFFIDKEYSPPATERAILLLRDPRDIAVSHYHHLMTKNGGAFDVLKQRVQFPADYEIGEFIRSDFVGIRHILAYAARWSSWAAVNAAPVFYYEDFVDSPEATLRDFLLAAGVSQVLQPPLRKAVKANTFERLRDAERKTRGQRGADGEDSSMRRMRKGKVGGFVEEVSEEDAVYMTRMMERADIPALRRYLTEPMVSPPDTGLSGEIAQISAGSVPEPHSSSDSASELHVTST